MFFDQDGEILDQAWQYCDNGRDISGDPYAETDATEKRLWTPNGDLIESWTRVTSDHPWEREN